MKYKTYFDKQRAQKQRIKIIVFIIFFYSMYFIQDYFISFYHIENKFLEPYIKQGSTLIGSPIFIFPSLFFDSFNLKRNDWVLVDLTEKGSYNFRSFERLVEFATFKLINFHRKKDFTVLEILGLPGDTIKINNLKIYVKPKGQKDFIAENKMSISPSLSDYNRMSLYYTLGKEIVLGKDEYFLLSNNRGLGEDSLSLGPIKKEQFKEKILLEISSFSSWKLLW
jgi:signal peptidase I